MTSRSVLRTLLCAVLVLTVSGAGAVDGDTAIGDYETRLEEIAGEIQQLRRELDMLVADLVEQEAGRVFVFLEGPASGAAAGVVLQLDDKTVFSRALTAAEQDVLQRGLPLELADLRLIAGEHALRLGLLGGNLSAPVSFPLGRGALASWIGRFGESGVEWRSE